MAGGGTDIPAYCEIHGGHVLNATIDRYVYATLKAIDEPCIRFLATDQQQQLTVPLADSLTLNRELALHTAVYRKMIRKYNGGEPVAMEVSTFCDAPIGSGLGSSSTVVVTLIQAFAEFFRLPLDNYAISKLAFEIERGDCSYSGGGQDHFSATFGGFNFMEFYSNNQTIITPLRLRNWIVCELEASLVLFYTGISRKSSSIIEDQIQFLQKDVSDGLEAMHEIKQQATNMRDCLLGGNFAGLVDIFNQGWESKKKTSKLVSNSQIDRVYEAAIAAGALAGKVSGAGGGGFMMFFVPLDKRMNVISALQNFEGQISNCHFTDGGVQSWKI